ncbi:two-component sensor histidine kinase [Corynebacterium yudongzhengii]|uniref:Sensor-like histidine kinase SenX3 n=2 Tax=Corynebacterium yudongzhengii TaxID=2080740 RepID=A0A2U1TA10_9CORY|nr:ATP-binding protein [Corynebacterium yudongzhengii]AWB82902.1 two-component sensor histidine kinase [Corynebacterium yudongzhengii]PWC02831.1 two-component sensor histidine kinase [Corynebacterium yudongzhengii]
MRIKERIDRMRSTATFEDNQVTTVSQVLHLVTQGSPTAVTVVDRSGGVILSNSRAHDMAIVHDRTINPEVWEVAQKVFEDKESRVLELSMPHRRTGNRVTHVSALLKPLTLVDDRFLIIYGTDESEAVRMENARRDFVANVSHELKTPVGGMSLLAEALLDSVDDVEHVEYFGQKLLDESQRMGDMISELISLSKLQGAEALPEMAPVAVDDLVDEAIARNQLNAESAGIELTAGKPGGLQVIGDKTLLVTALSNLISNAINYSPNALPVTVSQKVVDDVVHIRVTDRGIGIAPEDQKRVFERFYRVDRARSRATGGTGLGLAIVKHVVANHGGNIKLWSRPGTGSTFTIELPIHWPEKPERKAEVEEDGDSALRKAVSRVKTRRKDKTS